MTKSYIWTLPTRVFHWLFALLITLAFLSDDDDLLKYHAIIGYAILILLFFRIVWGFFGPKHSRFKDFPLGIKNVKDFLASLFSNESKYVGHNPLASYVMLGLLGFAFLAILSGALTYGIQEGKGIFSYLNSSFFKEMELFEEIHEFFANLLLFLIFAHLMGVFSDKVLHPKYETLKSIFNGYKKTDTNETVKLNIFQKIFSFIMLAVFIWFIYFNISNPTNQLNASIFKPQDFEAQNELFVSECASCHTLYPPNLLPKKSWEVLMSDLENHFGDDASLEEDETKNILEFLVKNSAENSTQQASLLFLKSIANKDIIAMSETKIWKKIHDDIPEDFFLHDEIKSKANCKACHLDIEKGLLDNDQIKNINSFIF